jgi:lysophospholipase L1-like esterase
VKIIRLCRRADLVCGYQRRQRGDTTAEALARIFDAVLSKNPRLVIVLLGGNDFCPVARQE